MAIFKWEILLIIILPFFIFFLTLERFLSMHGPLKGFSACFKKAPINPVYPSLDITV